MHAAHEFLKTLAIVLGVAAVTTIIFQRLRQPVVLGYIIAGLLVGPHVPLPLHADQGTVHTLSELGVILLMFAIGLELTIEKLVRVAPTAGLVGFLQVALMMVAGFAIGRSFGWTPQESIFAGAAIAISSTTIIAKVFDEMKVDARLRELVYGVLIVEDVIAIVLLATMTTMTSGDGLDTTVLAITTGKLAAFLTVMVVAGLLVVPRLMRSVVRLGRPETTLVASVGICFVFAFACAAFHYSVALGAFVAGVLISESGKGHDVEELLRPVRDMFAAIFFVSVGMLIDPKLVLENWLAVLVLSAAVIAGKVASVTMGGVVAGCGLRTSVKAGMSLSQIGEFSFIIAGLGASLGVTRPFLYPVAVAVSAITTLTTPALIRRAERAALATERIVPAHVVSFIGLYSAWLERVRKAPTTKTRKATLRRLLILLVLDGVFILAILIGGALLHGRAADTLSARWGLGHDASFGIIVAVAALLGAPFLYGVVRLTRAIALVLVGVAGEEKGVASASRQIAIAVQLGLLSAFGAVIVAGVEPFVPPGVGVLLLGGLFVVAALAFRRSARRFEVEVRAGGSVVFDLLKMQIGAPADASHHHDSAPSAPLLAGVGEPKMFRIEAGSRAVGRTLAEIDLRARTGAAVLAIVRGGTPLLLPDGTEKLGVGDLVAAVGSDDALAGANGILAPETGGGGQ